VLLLTGVFLPVNVSALALRRDRVEHARFTAPTAALVADVIVSFAFLPPVVREGAVYLLAGWLLLGGAVLWAATAATTAMTRDRS
jgi:APA family basic amino acid/polyamine antiporter